MSFPSKTSCTLREATASIDDSVLVVSTGRMSRTWHVVEGGLATAEVRDIESGAFWAHEPAACDWELPDGSAARGASITAVSAEVSDDEGFTSDHICVTVEIAYAWTGLRLRLSIWAYPGAPGIRTQLAAKRVSDPPTVDADDDRQMQGQPAEAVVDRVPVGDAPACRVLIGYYNDTQRRNDTHHDLLKEETLTYPLSGTEWCDWASAFCIESPMQPHNWPGIALVKESHKCVNQPGHATGGFVCSEAEGLACTGWGLRDREIVRMRFTPGWATWCLVWSGGEHGRRTAFKEFDRARYPIDPTRDIYVQANTWGSTDNSRDARLAATEASVLEELESVADLGIDVLQIDDGWQVPPGHHTWQPEANGWQPDPDSYPDGWTTVRDRAAALGVKMGLWAAAQPVSLEELEQSRRDGGFVQYKLDFAGLDSREKIDDLMQKVRAFIASTDHRVRVNWDVTENAMRYGYFFAREYGCIYLENRKPRRPLSTVYRPHTVLRDLWQVAHYLNLHRFQCSIQNVDRVDPLHSDACLHSHRYAVAVALMGIPLFFQETKFYDENARHQIRPLLATYKQHRDAMCRGMVHPIGDKPDNGSWTGFQCHNDVDASGYLTIFRERCNAQPSHTFVLHGLRDVGSLHITDLRTGASCDVEVGPSGVRFDIEVPPDFLFLRYTTT